MRARLDKPSTCSACLLYSDGCGFSDNEGAGTNQVLVVGEALGFNEKADGLPFRPQAQAGSLLERAFRRCGYSRSQFRLTNIVRCQPPHDFLAGAPYEFSAIQHCRQYLVEALKEKDWKCILALGGTAFRELTGYEGAKQGISYCRGYVLPCVIAGFEHVPVIGTFHPSFLRQGKPSYFGVLAHDIKRAVTIASQSGEWMEVEYQVAERVYDDADIPF